MAILQSKLVWALVALVITLALLFVRSRTVMHTEIFIEAPPEEVWAVISDIESYPEWNPVIVQVDGQFEVGAALVNHVVEPGKDAVEMNSTVRAIIPNEHLNQGGGLTGVITFDHHYYLKPENGGTRVIQHEVDQGLYMYFWDSSWVEPAYASVNQALKDRVESARNEGIEQS